MSNCLNKIKNKREMILTGEIGALLHDIGKLHPDFVKSKSIEKTATDYHAQIDKFLDPDLLSLIKNKKFEITIYSNTTNIYKLIAEHHNYNINDGLVKLLQGCDRKDSADDKGIVRKKQSIKSTIISSPFGYPKEKIDLYCLQKRFKDLEANLIGLFRNYISGTISLTCFRESLINALKAYFPHTLGETRIPANDVTLWDHSYSTASLFKTVLAEMICGVDPDLQNLKWRIFGICWDGLGFINKGRKIAEIKARNEIIENIKKELKRKFEDEIPIGNAVYEDTNGIYFTFPDLADESKDLAKECAKEALKIIYKMSDSELWPFFTLSKTSGTLTIIADELKFASEKKKIPKMSPTLFIEGSEEWVFENPEIATPSEGQDVCPICRIRPKDVKKERCDICEERRRGRLLRWLSNRQDTIWIDEVADINNRIALISLNFYLDKWLDGTMIGTTYSQSFEDWLDKEKENLSKIQDVLKEKIKKQIDSLEKAIENMKKAKDPSKVKARINEKIKEKKELEQKIKQLTFILIPEKRTIYKVLDIFFKVKDNDREIAAKILDTFFEENIGLDKNTLEKHLTNIKERIGTSSLTKENLATYLFTQNPSPARLYRIWQETEEFFDLVIGKIKDKIYSIKWKRIKFSVNYIDLKSKLKQGKRIEKGTPYIIQIDNLEPQKLLVFHNENGEFYTIESLGKFKFNNKMGEEAVKEALKHGFKHFALEDDPDKNLLQLSYDEKIKPDENSIETEEYYPLIEINKSPLSLRLMVPALDSMKVIELVTKLYNERFEKVLGKLPLNAKLLVAKRKFPLYILLDAENRMLEGEGFKKQMPITPWWNVNGMRNDKYYGFYPTKPIEEDGKYSLDDLSSISKGKVFHLYLGYFDFDLLLGTTDRYSIYYKGGKRGCEDYKLFTGRPYYFYQISEILELWDVLSNLPSSQINFIEEMLTSKLREWRSVEDENRQNIFREFAEATLKDAFGGKWNGLRDETKSFLVCSAINGLLLDTIILFRHIIKVKGVDEYE
ncbi:CRISPR-associated protein Csx11 [Archaeoglobales archaeon]|nr:MAG: CRISPR-associated protein Csx11 [Archaeoglobales archaeon]